MVFVLGIDRNQLSSSIKAVYGEIDVDGYLWRFLDLEFALPAVESAVFCRHLMDRHVLASFFKERSVESEREIHNIDYAAFTEFFPELCNRFELSLRDMEHLIRLFILAGRNVEKGKCLFPVLLSVLLLLRLKNHDLYLQYVQGKCLPSHVLNNIEKLFGDSTKDARCLRNLELALYATGHDESVCESPVVDQLRRLLDEKQTPTALEHLSERTKRTVKEEGDILFRMFYSYLDSGLHPEKSSVGRLSEMIELAAPMVKERE